MTSCINTVQNKKTTIYRLASIILLMISYQQMNAQNNIIPLPVSYESTEEVFLIDEENKLECSNR